MKLKKLLLTFEFALISKVLIIYEHYAINYNQSLCKVIYNRFNLDKQVSIFKKIDYQTIDAIIKQINAGFKCYMIFMII